MSKIVIPKNILKEKVGSGGFREESIKKAQSTIENNDVDFNPIASEYLNKIRSDLSNYENHQDSPRLYSGLLDHLTQLRAQGSMFQYSSITVITDIVVDLLDSLKNVDDKLIEIINAYEKCATILLKQRIKDQNSPTCMSIAKELKNVCVKYKAKYNV
jgi:hypothetical protein